MPLSNYERHILAQLELDLAGEAEHPTGIKRNDRRRRVLAGVVGPIGLLVGLLIVLLGVGLNSATGAVLAAAGYLVTVASGYAAAMGVRAIRADRRASRP